MNRRQLVVGIALLSLASGAAGSGLLPAGNVIPCASGSFTWGRPSAAPIKTDSMEPVEVCLRSKEGRELVLRAPGAYYNAVIRDADGRNVFVHFEVWAMPDPRPVSAIPELRHSVPGVDRGKFYKANEKRRILIEVSSELMGKEGYESVTQGDAMHVPEEGIFRPRVADLNGRDVVVGL